ncbi:MAG: hypothetical protein ACXVO9_05485 [Bacteroidia bacterium]
MLLFLLYRAFGFNTLNEGDKYLSEAGYLAEGNISAAFEHQYLYSVYIIYLSFFVFFKLPVSAIFVCTYLLSLYSYCIFYRSFKELVSVSAAKTWMALMLLSPMLQFWQFNLFSETFFIALSLIFISMVLRKETRYRTIKLFLFALFLIFSRPSGIFVVLTLLCYNEWPNKVQLKKNLALISVLLTGLFIGFVFFVPLHYRGFSYEIASGSVYCGIPTLTPTTLPSGDYTLAQCYLSIIHDQSVTTLAVLFFKKIASFFVITRPHYSSFHNYINGSHVLFYLLAIAGVYISKAEKKIWYPFLISLIAIILLNALMVGLVFNEWTERYTVQIFPFVFALAAYPLSLILVKMKKGFAF